ncbi:uncharacterized protein LOC133904283 isoform X2 [Phragmites australis]|nr:uncharacterized protein LOC133904283 isoform X2 [Phragmites australis]
MATATAGGEKERGREGLVVYVLALPAALPLPVAVSRMDAAVPRKARTCRPRVKPSGWWAFRLLVPPLEEAKNPSEEARLPVLPPSAAKNTMEEAMPPHSQRLRVPPPPDLDTAAPVKKKPAKRSRRCLHCGSAETPQWRSGPMGRGTLCNACGVRLRAAGALRESEHRPPPATVRTVAEPLSLESALSDPPPDIPIWEPHEPPRDVYLVRKPSKRRRPPRKEAAPEPAIYLVKKKKLLKKPWAWRPRNTGKSCLHCGSSSTPQWREGPLGRGTLCNACGVRYRQGRLLPEYRPVGSPTFVPSEHANRHREVLQLHRQRQDKNHHPPPPKQPQPVDDSLPDPRVGGNGHSADTPWCDGDDLIDVLQLRRQRQDKDQYPPTPLHRPLPQPVDDSLAGNLRVGVNSDSADALAGCGGGNDLTDMPRSLDSLLLDGPSAPLIVDGDEFLIS